MKLAIKARESETKGALKQIRREGNIPAILYSSKTEAQKIIVDGTEFSAALRQIKSGQLPTTVFSLSGVKRERKAIVKDIQYHPTTYIVFHIDFEELVDGVPVNVKVPVNYTGIADCVGVKLGGFLRPVARHVKVESPIDRIPREFLVDVRDLGIRQSKRLKDIVLPEGVRPLASPEEVLVVVAKR